MADLRVVEGGREDDEARKDVRAAIDDHFRPAVQELEDELALGHVEHLRLAVRQIHDAAEWLLNDVLPPDPESA